LPRLCGQLAPAARVSLEVGEAGLAEEEVVTADDWMEMPGAELLSRIAGEELGERRRSWAEKVSQNLRTVRDHDGKVVGRLALLPPNDGLYNTGVFVVGGLRSDRLYGCAGVLEGFDPTAARDEAQMCTSHEEIARWAEEQEQLLAPLLNDPADRIDIASRVSSLGGMPSTLPICRTASGFLTFAELQEWVKDHEEVLLLDLSEPESDFYSVAGSEEPFEPAANVVILHGTYRELPSFMHPPGRYQEPDAPTHYRSLESVVEQALAIGWGFDPYAEVHPDDLELEDFWESGGAHVGMVAGRAIKVSWVTPMSPRFAEQFGWSRSEQ
jgi:hypothetical protein